MCYDNFVILYMFVICPYNNYYIVEFLLLGRRESVSKI